MHVNIPSNSWKLFSDHYGVVPTIYSPDIFFHWWKCLGNDRSWTERANTSFPLSLYLPHNTHTFFFPLRILQLGGPSSTRLFSVLIFIKNKYVLILRNLYSRQAACPKWRQIERKSSSYRICSGMCVKVGNLAHLLGMCQYTGNLTEVYLKKVRRKSILQYHAEIVAMWLSYM